MVKLITGAPRATRAPSRSSASSLASGAMGRLVAAALVVASPLLLPPGLSPMLGSSQAVHARELASGSGSRVNKDPQSLLRLGLPKQSKEVRELQAALEECQDSVTRLLYSNANSALGKAKGVLKSKSAAIVKTVPKERVADAERLLATVDQATDALKGQIAAGQVGAAAEGFSKALDAVTQVEELTALTYTVPAPPAEFANLPYLKGRATVDMVLKRDGAQFDVEGKLYDKLEMSLVLDGYNAPITAGNFVDLVQKGFYNGYHIQRSDGFVVQTGDPAAEDEKRNQEIHGYVPPGAPQSAKGVRKIPLEVFVKGDKNPIYGSTFDDDGRGGYASTLPFNAYGALGMAREEYDSDSASSQWFWLLFDSDLTPAGKNLLDGRYTCFGYTTKGARLLSDVKEGDVIVSAKVVSGYENLVLPKGQEVAADAEEGA